MLNKFQFFLFVTWVIIALAGVTTKTFYLVLFFIIPFYWILCNILGDIEHIKWELRQTKEALWVNPPKFRPGEWVESPKFELDGNEDENN